MPLWKSSNKSLIPPVEQPSYNNSPTGSSASSRTKSSSSTYVASRDGDLYNNNNYYNYSKSSQPQDDYSNPAEEQTSYVDKYSRSRGVGDIYSRGDSGHTVEQDRNELFSGYNPQKSGGSGRFFDGPAMREPAPGEENDDDVEGIKQQMRYVKQESASSTRNALRMAREAEETARNTLGRLGDQSERLANTEMHLDMAKLHTAQASDKTDELKKLNRSIFRPAITFNKDAKRRAQEMKIQDRYDEQKNEREKAMVQIRETQDRVGRAQTYGRGGDVNENDLMGEESLSGRRYKTEEQRRTNRAANSRYRFEATASDDEVEDEIDDNLDEIGESVKRLKALGLAMGDEVDAQNKRIDVISTKTDNVDNKLFNVTARVSIVPSSVSKHADPCSFYSKRESSRLATSCLYKVFMDPFSN
ncbi:hypothetical protein K435DRAFT_656121 [Dendrothele bispora CBS 962.96]|uniref:t-SNARE coiled-coil homology domain-containing protein n=1 Tax=Dendrothele bispora (strain CBS 962.96) TaxID=1314807 RepID=A0A4S8MF53_DENBC|nr:hypothetical protein K435DRAFT_656121 [Dendrothele bispora CBS 962.96]